MFVMLFGDNSRNLHDFARGVLQQLLAVDNVFFDFLEFFGGKLAGLGQNLFVNAEFAYVVQHCRNGNIVGFLFGKAEALGQNVHIRTYAF